MLGQIDPLFSDFRLVNCIGNGLCGFEAFGLAMNNEMFGKRIHWLGLH